MSILQVARPEQVPAIVEVAVRAMPESPQWDYRFPYRDDFPDDHYKYTSMLYQQFADPANRDWLVLAVVVPPRANATDAPQAEGQGGGHIVAFAVYDVSYVNKRLHGDSYEPFNPAAYVAARGGSTRRDMNPAHQRAFRESGKHVREAVAQYLDRRLCLQILATHPDHRRRGYARLLCQWGMRLATKEGLVMTLTASAGGKLLYDSLDFTPLRNIVYQAPGEEEKVEATVLAYVPEAQTSERSESLLAMQELDLDF
ncbi:hypothetical protein B0I35DRAFT_412200 [Stachybotrys elegans]|uniref:N-acetyltransferase domain-containing protein n=1 Tax=Stachybotrys elegans TaxID=80388 RepID=A0A8K0SKJ7_9HYPO|nr:hypothetical protein B0I35DRAFT_412200 [Stachybotrys elegans]